jgi:hypothetical protein
MNLAQRQYELGFRLLNSTNFQRFNTTNYFKSIDVAKNRPNQFPSPKKIIIKKTLQEPYKDFFVLRANRNLRLRLNSIESKPVIPKINVDYVELGQRMKNNKERTRELYNRALSLENERFANRVFTQKPRIITTKVLEKLYLETHNRLIEQLKSPSITRYHNDFDKVPVKLPKLSSYKNGQYKIHSRTEANLDSDNEEMNNNSSVELKDHGHKEISHQKQGHIE